MTEIELKKLEPALKLMKETYPFIRPKVIVRDYVELKNLYENQQLDLVISTYGLSEHGNFKRISTYESCAVMADNHPLAKEKELAFVLGGRYHKFLSSHRRIELDWIDSIE